MTRLSRAWSSYCLHLTDRIFACMVVLPSWLFCQDATRSRTICLRSVSCRYFQTHFSVRLCAGMYRVGADAWGFLLFSEGYLPIQAAGIHEDTKRSVLYRA